MRVTKKPVIAIDLGGTKYITAVIDGDCRTVSRIYRLTQARQGPKKVIDRLIDAIREVVEKSGINPRQLGGIGIAAAGLIDTNRGLITESPNLNGWKNILLSDILSDEFKIPAFMINDASAAALGEFYIGAGKGLRNLIFLTVSTGIGGGIIINGELYEGANGCAGEIGHMIIKEDGPLCSCGRYGCLEAMASGSAIARMAKESLSQGMGSILLEGGKVDKDDITAEAVSKGAKLGDSLCCDVVNRAAYYLGIGLGNLVNIFNPEMIVIGGGVSAMGNLILKPARKSMRAHAFKLPSKNVSLVKAKLGMDSGLLGVALYTQLKIGGRE